MSARKNQLVSPSDSNSLIYNQTEKQLLLSYSEKNTKKGRADLVQLLSRYEKIAGKQALSFRVLGYFYQNGCSFARDLHKQMNISTPASFRGIETLYNAGFIYPLSKSHIPNKIGKKTTLYGVLDVTEEEIDQAVARELYYNIKNYSLVESLYQRTLPEICDESIQMSKIVSMARRTGSSRGGLHFIDIAEHVARKQIRSGVKVWR